MDSRSHLALPVKPYHAALELTEGNRALTMNIGRSGAIFILFALAMLCSGVAKADDQTFRFRVCNTSNVGAAVATLNHVAAGDSRFEVQGWWTVNPGDCDWIGYFPKGWFYYFAEQTGSGNYVWEGSDTTVCVRHPGPWERIIANNYTCRSDEDLHGFTSDLIDSDTGTFTVTLN